MNQPLKCLKIVDLSTVLSGPIAVALLADQGAEVIKIESPEGDTCRLIGPAKGDMSAMFIAANRGKRSIALDLKSPSAREIVDARVRHNGTVVEIDHGEIGRVRLARAAGRFDGEPLPAPAAAAHLGEHGRAVLEELGFDTAQIAKLLADGVLHLP